MALHTRPPPEPTHPCMQVGAEHEPVQRQDARLLRRRRQHVSLPGACARSSSNAGPARARALSALAGPETDCPLRLQTLTSLLRPTLCHFPSILAPLPCLLPPSLPPTLFLPATRLLPAARFLSATLLLPPYPVRTFLSTRTTSTTGVWASLTSWSSFPSRCPEIETNMLLAPGMLHIQRE